MGIWRSLHSYRAVRSIRGSSSRLASRWQKLKAASGLTLEPLEERMLMAIGAGPDLVEIVPNDGAPLVSGDVRNVSPREIVLRFDSTQVLDATTLGAIQMLRSGGDGLFDSIGDVAITPAYRALGDRSNEVVLRFSERLPDDLFRIHIVGAGAGALENTDNQPFNGGADLDLDFRLDQGTQVVGVVPQPVTRGAGNALTYANVLGDGLNQVEVYFDAPISQLTAGTGNGGIQNPAYYQLIFTNGTATTVDDSVATPVIVHSPIAVGGQTKVVLQFNPSDLDDADAGSNIGTYRLRVGDANAPLPAPLAPIAPADAGSSYDTSLNLGAIGAAAQIINGQTDVQTYGLTLPGGQDDPGHRDVPGVSHLAAGEDTTPGITTIYYDFRDDYGKDSLGNTLSNQILVSPAQQQRVREIFDLYSHYLGVQFVETTPAIGVPSVPGSITVAVGLLSAVNPAVASGIGGATGIAGVPNPAFPANSSRLVVMDNADFSGAAINQFGAAFMRSTMQQIGSLLGFGVATDLPDLTVNGTNPSLLANSFEAIFPGDADILHGQHLYRPESNDIDLYRFDVPAGQHGVFTAETTAERLAGALGASNLDTVISLYGDVTILTLPLGIAINDGNHFTVSDGLNPPVTFEFNNVGTVAAGRRAIDFLPSDTSEQIAQKVATALSGIAGLDVDPVLEGNQIRLLGVSSVDVSNAPFVLQSTSRELLSRNDDYYSEDSFVELRLRPGAYYVGVTSTGNTYNPEIANSGFGGTTEGRYELRLEFRPDTNNVLRDVSGVPLDGDGDGRPGGVFNFHFQASNAANTIYVDKVASNIGQLGTLTNPFNNIQAAITAAAGTPGRDIIRIVANGGDILTGGDGLVSTTADNITYEVGFNASSAALADGSTFRIPQNTTVMIDPGVIIKLRQASIEVGSTSTAVAGDRSQSHLQVLGVPGPGGEVLITSYHNEAVGKDLNPAITNPARGDWGGLVFRNDVDRIAGRRVMEDEGIFYNYVNHASISYGGGQLQVGPDLQTFNPIYMIEARPTVTNNTISTSADAAMSAGPNSFADTRFQGPNFTADYDRVGPDIHGNRLSDNSFNALFVRIETSPGQLRSLDTSARFDDTDIVHMLAENLVIRGTAGGNVDPDGPGGAPAQARLDGRLAIDPGVIVKLRGARIETQFGAEFLAEGTAEDPVLFVSVTDDRYGAGGTFDTNNNAAATAPAAGDWGGLYFSYLSHGSIDHARITHGGGETTIEGGFANFNAVEIHRADVRVANSTLANNATGDAATNRNGRGDNEEAVVFVRGAQPVIVNNVFRDNLAAVIHIDVNSLNDRLLPDPGHSRGAIDRFDALQNNYGPLVRLNRIGNNELNGMEVRSGVLTTGGVWDDTDIVHVVRNEISVSNLHSGGGLRLQSGVNESLVVKLQGLNAGFTATGRPLDIDDRIGGAVQLVGTPGHEVTLTALGDLTVGAGFEPDGVTPQTDTLNTGLLNSNPSVPQGNSGAVIIDGGDRDDHGFALTGPDNLVGTADDINRDGWLFIEQMLDFALAGARNGAPRSILALVPPPASPFTTTATSAIISTAAAAGAPVTFVTGAGISAVNFNNFQVLYVPSDINVFGGISNADQALLAARKTDIQNFVNSGGSLVALTEANSQFPYSWLELPLPFTINNFIANTALRKTPEAIAAGFTITDTELSNGTPYHNSFTGPPGFNGLKPFVLDNGLDNRAGTADDQIITLGLASGSFGIGVTQPANPGDWRSVQLQQFSNDRNVEIAGERETVTHTATPVNNTPGTAQLLGELAPNQLSGSDDRRLGFQVQGFLNSGDVDVYSFIGTAGTEIWLDIDRTTAGLDTILELTDETGAVLARSNNSTGGLVESDAYNLDGFITNAGAGNLGRRMQRDAFTQVSTSDLFTSNIHDAGMRVVLPFLNGAQDRYFVRVRSNSNDITNLTAGRTTGNYQLQVRLQETDEAPGSTVQHSNIRFATDGIDIEGLPKHSPLLGDTSERPADAGDELFAGALPIGNVLQTDRGALSVAGALATSTDVDWYSFTLNHDLLSPVTGSRTWSTVFDIDYADGLSRPDTGIAVYASTGELLFVGRESDLLDDRDSTGTTPLSAGSVGLNDPYIGSVQLPAGLVNLTSRQYLVAVFSNGQVPNALNANFTVGSTNRTVRLEPVNSIERVAEDHIGVNGYTSGQPATGVNQVNPQTSLFDVQSSVALATNVRSFTLSDVPLYVSTGTTVQTVDPATGALETAVGPYVGGVQTLRDIAFRSDGRLHGVDAFTQPVSDPGFLTLINPGTAARSVVGGDNLFTLNDSISALTYLRTGFSGTAPTYELYYASGDNAGGSRLVRANYLTGSATGAAPANSRALGVIGTGIFSAAAGDRGVTTGMAFVGQSLYGVSNTGRLYTIDLTTGRVTTDLSNNPGVAFAGLSLGPQNLDFDSNGIGSDLSRTLFAITEDGQIFAFDEFGAPAIVFDTDANGTPDSAVRSTGVNIPAGEVVTGLAFSPLDYNLWHPTLRGRADAGHGTTTPVDGSRSPALNQHFVNGRPITEGEGGASFYFGLENWVADPDVAGSTSYFDYGVNSQYGIQSAEAHQDLVSTTGVLANSYDLPGGAQGSLVTDPFSLQGYGSGDKPTLYFNYLLRTENANSSTPGQMRDSARVFVSADGGATWSMVATNNSIRDGQGELPQFYTANSVVPGGDVQRQRVQELFETPAVGDRTWRQARVDLSEFAGQGNLLLRFDFSTAGTMSQGLPGDVFGDATSNTRLQNNAFEGFYVDDILVGFAERGEMVTAAPTNQNAFTPITADPNAPPPTLTGAYQLEIRRGTEYATAVPVAGTVSLIDPALVVDTNDRLVQGFNITTVAGASTVDGQTLRIGDGVTAVVFEFDVDNSVVDTATLRAIDYLPGDSAAAMAQKVRDAINAHIPLGVVASVVPTSNIVELFHAAEVTAGGPAPLDLTVSISAGSMSESGGTAMVTVTRSGSTANPLNVVLTSDDPLEVSVPAPFQIPAGLASIQVPIMALNDLLADGTQTVQILATAAGYNSISDTIDVTDVTVAQLAVVIAAPKTFSEDAGLAVTTATVTRNTPTNASLLVNLISSDPSEAQVQATVLIPAGQASATFSIDAVNDPWIDGTQGATITAYASGFLTGSDSVVVTDDGVDTTVQTFSGGTFIAGPPAAPAVALNSAFAYLGSQPSAAGFGAADLTNFAVTNQYASSHTGVTHVYLRQKLNGLEILGTEINVNVAPDGSVLNMGGDPIPTLAFASMTSTPQMSAIEAIRAAAVELVGAGLGGTEVTTLEEVGGITQTVVLSAPEVSLDPITARLGYVSAGGGVELVWNLVVRTTDGEHWYDVAVNASSGEIPVVSDWIDDASYEAFNFNLENPTDGARSIQANPQLAAPNASPFGWHDTNGLPGAEFTDTQGNNVSAQEDLDANNVGGVRPSGGATLDFTAPLNPALDPTTYTAASTINLFYMNNILHDVHYQYGFNEISGNFQVNNYGKGGLGSDGVQADAQDGSGFNNANFGTPPDGIAPRMQQFIFNITNPRRDSDIENTIIIHEFGHGISNRLTGGPANVNALNAIQSGGMGEGWGDWWGLMFTQKPTDTQLASYPIGNYVLGQPQNGPGIRRFPYSFDMSIDPLTYGRFNGGFPNNEVHNSGEIWCSALWDLNWLLINKYGFDSDLYTGYTATPGPGHAGNKLALQLVMDGLKLQPVNPSFLDARDAILQADQLLTGGANLPEIWTAFARRGMGLSAFDGGSGAATTVVEAFDVPVFGTGQTISVAINLPTIIETGINNTTTATVTRSGPTTDALQVSLISTDQGEAIAIPTVLTIPAGQSSMTFQIQAVDDSIVDGTQTVVIRALAPLFNSVTDTIDVVDDEFPALAVSIAPELILANDGSQTAEVTVTRNTPVDVALPIRLLSSDLTEIRVPDAPSSITMVNSINSFNGGNTLSSLDNFYTGKVLSFTSGVLSGQSATIIGYVGATRTFTFAAGSFGALPGVSDSFAVLIAVIPAGQASATFPLELLDEFLPGLDETIPGVVSSATSSTSFSSTGLSTVDDFYNGRFLTFTSGALAGQTATILDYVSATGTFTFVGGSFTGTPAIGSAFSILRPTFITARASGFASGSDSAYFADSANVSLFDRLGDENIERPQGQVIIANNIVTSAAQAGIRVDAVEPRAIAAQPHPGAVRNLGVLNPTRLAPSITIENNVVAFSGQVGILFSGDANAAPNPQGATAFGRIVNNTTFGGSTAAGIGIQVTEFASPTILNNIVSNFDTGVSIDATAVTAGTVLGGTVYKGNNNDTSTGSIGMGSFPLALADTDALFRDPALGDFELVQGSTAIDSSINVVPERPELAAIYAAYGIQFTDVTAPLYDITGRLRVDNPFVNSFPGLGANVFKDRGAIERLDPVLMNMGDLFVVEGDVTVDGILGVMLSEKVGFALTVVYTTSNGTAEAGADYTATSGTLTFAPGDTIQLITVPILGDTRDEADETFFVTLSNLSPGAFIGDAQGVVTIDDNDLPPTFSINDISQVETDVGTTNFVFTVTQSSVSGKETRVSFATRDSGPGVGTAVAGSDYQATTGTLTFAPNSTAQTFTVRVNGDPTVEPDETFFVDLLNPVEATLLDSIGQATILDDEPVLSVSSVTVTEGNTGVTSAVFVVSLNKLSQANVIFDFATVARTPSATSATAGSDYTSSSGTTFIPAGVASINLTVQVVGDTLGEQNELFDFQISNIANAKPLPPAQLTASATIVDDEPRITISDVTINPEGNVGTKDAVFQITLDRPSPAAAPVTVLFSTADGTAISGQDYSTINGLVSFAAGSQTQLVTVSITGDVRDENDETFVVNLTGEANALLVDNQGQGTIVDDDPLPAVTIGDVSANETDSGTTAFLFPVQLSAESGRPVLVTFTALPGTAAGGLDYNNTSGTLTFTPGQTSQNITVQVKGDVTLEPNETFTVELSIPAPATATLGDPQATGTILDDEGRVTITGTTVVEGTGPNTAFVFDVVLSKRDAASNVVVNYATADGSGVNPARGTPPLQDYLPAAGSLTFTAGAGGPVTQSITVQVLGDTRDEFDETFEVNLTSGEAFRLANSQAIGQITDDDGPPTISIGDASVAEGDMGVSNAVFDVVLSSPSSMQITVAFATANGAVNPALAGVDYNSTTSTLTFLPNQSTQKITVQALGDLEGELDETFFVNLASAVNATIADNQGQGTIVDNEPRVTVTGVTVTEGDSLPVQAEFVVRLTKPSDSGQPIRVVYSTDLGSGPALATDGVDYTGTTGSTLTFSPGETAKSIFIPVLPDLLDEDDETFSLKLNSAVNALVQVNLAEGRIVDNDGLPTMTIADISVTEGTGGTTNAVFTVLLNAPSGRQVSVAYATADATATTADGDYATTSGNLIFAPGETSRQITVPIVADNRGEPNEMLLMNLSSNVNATLPDAQAVVTIGDDEPRISILDSALDEQDAGSQNLVFELRLDRLYSEAVTVQYTTADGAALSPADYTPASGTVTFAANQTQQFITISVQGDLLDENDETFAVNLTSPSTNSVLLDASAVGTIRDNDTPPTVSIFETTVVEGNAGVSDAVFRVLLSQASGLEVQVPFATANGTATVAGSDYNSNTGVVTFAPGSTEQFITVQVKGDTLGEANETFLVNLTPPPVNASVADGQAVGTIDDDEPRVSVNDVTVIEADSATNLVFSVTLDTAPVANVAVVFNSSAISATASADYTPFSGTLTFQAGLGETLKAVTVQIAGDLLDEADESFQINLISSSVNAVILDNQGIGTIVDNDAPPSLSIGDAAVNEGHTGTVNLVFPVTLSAPSGQLVTVQVNTVDGVTNPATATVDYAPIAGGLVSFAPGETQKNVTVQVVGERVAEPNETLLVNLTNPVNAGITDGQAQGTILDDEPVITIDPVAVTEGNGDVSAVFLVRMDRASSQVVNVTYSTQDGTAGAPADYTAIPNGTLSFGIGQVQAQITVTVRGDTLNEQNETFSVALGSVISGNAKIGTGVATGTINNDDAQPSLAISSPAPIVEGNNPSITPLAFPVTLSSASGQTVIVNFITLDGTATSVADYDSAAGSLVFAPGETQKFATVQVRGDVLGEPNESFLVQLQSPVNANVSIALGTGTITDDEPRVAVDDISISEDDFSVTGVFTISLIGVATAPVGVAYSTAAGTATAGVDFDSILGGTVSFAIGESSKPITVTVQGDTLDENNETFLLNLSLTTPNAVLSDGQGVATILDNDPLPQISISDASVIEGDAGNAAMVFNVSLSAASGRAVTVNYGSTAGTATAGVDFALAAGAVSFAAGDTLEQVTVQVVGDQIGEFDETFSVNLSAAANGQIADGVGQGTIRDDDARLQISDAVVVESDGVPVAAVFSVTLTEPSPSGISVNYNTAGGTATSGVDFQPASGMLSFTSGNTQLSVTVNVLGDLLDEIDETFFLNLTGVVGTVALDTQGQGTINDNDPLPSLSINSVSVSEGNSGITNAVFTVTLSPVSGRDVTVEFITSPGSATAGSDYTSTSGTLTFATGQLQRQITVEIAGDQLAEANETFQVSLINPVNANLGTAAGTGTILDDEPRLTINDVTLTETDSGTANAVFTVSMDRTLGTNVTVNFSTADGTAAGGVDYQSASGTLTIAAGSNSVQVTVPVIGDVDEEDNETFAVNLSSPLGAVLIDNQGLGTIVDNDPRISINDITVDELTGSTAQALFTVTLSQSPDVPVTVAFATSNGTATAAADYTSVGGSLTFVVGETQRTITVNVAGDALNESNETFNVTLSGAVNGQIAQAVGVGTINDDDAQPTIAINSISVVEGNPGSGGSAIFTLTLSAPSGQTVAVNAAAIGVTANNLDFTATAGILTFVPGATAVQATVQIVGDTADEPNETFTLDLSSATNASLPVVPQGTATIVDDDPTISINDVSVNEPGNAVFTVSLSKAVASTVTLTFTTIGITATPGSDFTPASGTISFVPNQTQQTITVGVLGDSLDEINETFDVTLTLQSGSPGQLGDSSGRATIIDDDPAPNLVIGNATMTEGNSGLKNMVFTATLSAVSGQPVTAVFSTSNNTATAGTDYQATSSALSFSPGQTTQLATVAIIGDNAIESDETFFVHLSSVVGANANVTQGLGVIANDDVRPIFVTGADAGGGPHVRVFDSVTGAEKFGFMAYNPAFGGGVRVAAGDVNGDGVADVVTAPGFGGGPHVRVINGATGQSIYEFLAFDNAFKGLQVAMGDVNRDGRADLIVGTDGDASDTLSRVRVYDGPSGALLRHINLDATTGMQTGVRVAAGDVDGDGDADLILGSAPGVNSLVFVQDALSGVPISTFSPYPGFTGGVYVSGGDTNLDGRSEVITGAGAGGGPHVRIFNAGDSNNELAGFYAYDPAFGGGARVGATDFNGDGRADVITAAGPGGGPHVRIFSGVGFGELHGFFAYPGFGGGVNVGGSFRGVGQALQADGMGGGGAIRSLTQADVRPLVEQAISDWAAAGLSQRQLEQLQSVEVRIAALPAEYLATASHRAIMLDGDAAGHGWFVDSTPWSDEEFELLAEGTLRARHDSAAAAGMDLRTVLAHELGHILGLGHDEGEGVMEDTLSAGTRRLPAAEDVDGLFAAGSWE